MQSDINKLFGIPSGDAEQAAYDKACRMTDALYRERDVEQRFGFGSKEHREAIAERFRVWGLK